MIRNAALSLVLLAPLLAHAGDESAAQAAFSPVPTPGGPTTHGLPGVKAEDASVTHNETDVDINDSLGAISFQRTFTSNHFMWSSRASVKEVRPPFGRSPTRQDSLHWWHSFYSFVVVRPGEQEQGDPTEASVCVLRDTTGAMSEFPDCNDPQSVGPPTIVPGDKLSIRPETPRLVYEPDCNGFPQNTRCFVVVRPEGRFVYATHLNAPCAVETQIPGACSFYFLTRVEKPEYPRGNASLRYSISYTANIPNIDVVTTQDGSKLRFAYSNGSSTTNSRLTSVTLEGKQSGVEVVASYGYDSSNRLATVTRPAHANSTGSDVTTYSYLSGAGAREFRASRNGLELFRLPIPVVGAPYPDPGRATADIQPTRTWSVASAVPSLSDPDCNEFVGHGYCTARWQHFTDSNVRKGDGNNSQVTLQESLIGFSGLTYRNEISCSGTHCDPALFPLQKTRWIVANGHSSNGQPNGGLQSTTSAIGPRGFMTDYVNNLVQPVSPPPPVPTTEFPEVLETQVVTEGAGGAGKTTSYTYQYGGGGQTPRVHEQLIHTATSASSSSGSVVTTYVFDLSTNRLKAIIRTGKVFVMSAESSTLTAETRSIGVFYNIQRTCSAETSTDPLNRTVEVHGPCYVSGTSARSCDRGGFVPVTQNYFHPVGASNDSNRLHRVLKYSSHLGVWGVQPGQPNSPIAGCIDASAAWTETRFSNYDARGRPLRTQTWDAVAGAAIETLDEVYAQGDRLTQKTASGTSRLATTTFEWDNPTSTKWRTTFPAGNAEVACYRAGTSGGCVGGTPSVQLQWKARVASGSTGVSFKEKVEYEYVGANVSKETFRDATGAVRRIKRYEADPGGRPTHEAWGQLGYNGIGFPPVYVAGSWFDQENNPVGASDPYNEAPVFCGGPAGDDRCSRSTFDGLNRLASITDMAVPGQSATLARTNLTYDPAGNISSVAKGCNAGGAGCQSTLNYTYDDFGRLIQFTAPWQSGSLHFEYDAGGNVTRKRTAAMPTSQFLNYVWDFLGRLKSASAGSQALYEFAYDTLPSGSAPNCAVANASGRVSRKRDSFGWTYFQYDAFGNITRQQRQRTGATSCSSGLLSSSSNSTPDSVFNFTADGRLVSEKYPHGRVVSYGYGTSGNEDRVTDISVEAYLATHPIASVVEYEPYGGLRSYRLHPKNSADALQVDHLAGAGLADSLESNCGEGTSGNDLTGRERALTVSRWREEAGDIVFRRHYTWQATQIVQEATCLFDDPATGWVQKYQDASGYGGYDQRLQLNNANGTGLFTSGNGTYAERHYDYDNLGTRRAANSECEDFEEYESNQKLTSRGLIKSYCMGGSGEGFYEDWAYASDGRVNEQTGPKYQSNKVARTVSFETQVDDHAAVGSVYRSATVNDNRYEYFYDAEGRRRFKSYPTTTSQEFFFAGTQLKEDRGTASFQEEGEAPVDDYIWLAGKPIAVLKSRLASNLGPNQGDITGDCSRDDEQIPCGIYLIVPDYQGKPALMFNEEGLISGMGQYDIYGHVNRVNRYASVDGVGNGFQVGQDVVMAEFWHPSTTDLQVRMRARFALGDTSDQDDSVYLADNSLMRLSSHVSGPELGAPVTEWVAVPTDGYVKVLFSSQGSGGGTGFLLEGADVEKYQFGAAPVWTQLRFPGQYYDPETDLFENWNRFYDPKVGRFTAPDPVMVTAARALDAYPYAYAGNNPVSFVDSDGRTITAADTAQILQAAAAAAALAAQLEAAAIAAAMAAAALPAAAAAAFIYTTGNYFGQDCSTGAGCGSPVRSGGNPAVPGDPNSPQEVDRRISDNRRPGGITDNGVQPLDPDRPHSPHELPKPGAVPAPQPAKPGRGTRHGTGERNVSSGEEHSRVPKGSNGQPRRR